MLHPPDRKTRDTGGNDAGADESGTDATGDSDPSFGVVGAIAGLGGVSYLLKHRIESEDSE
jgi:hypothetical protein